MQSLTHFSHFSIFFNQFIKIIKQVPQYFKAIFKYFRKFYLRIYSSFFKLQKLEQLLKVNIPYNFL
jgi:hypothetical protein